MAMSDVRRVVESFGGSTDEMYCDSRACNLTVGDLRMLFRIAEQAQAQYHAENWPEQLGASLRKFNL